MEDPRCPSLGDQIDLAGVRGWLSYCDAEHSPSCNKKRFTDEDDEVAKIILVDVTRDCIVEASLADRFVILSYVWGGVDQLQLLISNQTDLSQPGVLSNPSLQPAVPRTIHDAMAVTKGIGERYLWVDTLCIVQDDPIHKKTQIAQMAAIYDAATVAIIACIAENANTPLPGVQSGSRLPYLIDPSRLNDSQAVWAQEPVMSLGHLLSGTPHRQRAWTFQEVLLSRRCLFFFGSKLFFQCQESRREEGKEEQDHNMMRNHGGNWPPLEDEFPGHWFRYGEMVGDYTRRKLSFPADRLDAFSGLATALSKTWGWDFHFALPVQTFNLALLWVPEDPVAINTSGKETLPIEREYPFPSWSWLSHPGASYYLLEVHPDNILPGLDWASTSIWDGNTTQNVKKNKPEPKPDNPPPSVDFLYKDYPPGTMTLMTHVVSLETMGLRPSNPNMDAFDTEREKAILGGHVYCPLISEKGKWFGTLVGITESQIRGLLEEEDAEVTLVLLSCTEKTWVMGGFRRSQPCFDKDEFENRDWGTYNVMLVKTDTRPSRRLAIGEVHRDGWDDMEPHGDLIWLA